MRSLHVEDSGPGLTDVQLSLLFQPFERLGAQRTPAPGVGLGLAVSQQLAQLINGPIEVRSEPGVGSCFTLGSRRPGLTGCVFQPNVDARFNRSWTAFQTNVDAVSS